MELSKFCYLTKGKQRGMLGKWLVRWLHKGEEQRVRRDQIAGPSHPLQKASQGARGASNHKLTVRFLKPYGHRLSHLIYRQPEMQTLLR